MNSAAKRTSWAILPAFLLSVVTGAFGQAIPEYTVSKCAQAPVIDGKLTEPAWAAAPPTQAFIHHADGTAARLSTQAKFLWDDQFLYIGFICVDPDVWAVMKNRDESLWKGEVVEVFCDPDGDGLNYFELEVNPLGTLLDLTMTKAYTAGGKSNLSWKLNFTAGVWVEGTINDSTDADKRWYCEMAIPFSELSALAPTMRFPPKDGDIWRILLARYDYERTGSRTVELSAWSQTNSSSFHVPERFGRVIFSSRQAVSVKRTGRPIPAAYSLANFPNPFNSSTVIHYTVPTAGSVELAIFDIFGKKIDTLVDEEQPAGGRSVRWHGQNASTGVYFYRLTTPRYSETKTMLLLK